MKTLPLLVALSLSLLLTPSSTITVDPNCTGNTQYFDVSTLECGTCPGNNTTKDTDGRSCRCDNGFFDEQSATIAFFPTCIACGSAAPAPARDGSACFQCDGTTTGFSTSINDCSCGPLQKLVEVVNGDTRTKRCEDCVSNEVGGKDTTDSREYFTSGVYDCVACPPGQNIPTGQTACQCDTTDVDAGAFCFNAGNNANANLMNTIVAGNAAQVQYRSLDVDGSITSRRLTSAVIQDKYLEAISGCALYDRLENCQMLANLCVLHLGDEDSVACENYKEVGRNPLIYDARAAYLPDAVAMHVAFPHYPMRGALEELTFYLSVYTLEGKWLGREELTSQFQFCPFSFTEERSFRKFGNTIQNSCDIDLSQFVSRDQQQFYELFLLDSNGSLVQIPVLIKNLHNESSQKPNTGTGSSGWRLMTRFFTYDNISGKESLAGNPTIIRYARSITLRVPLQGTDDARLFLPLLVIDFREKLSANIGTGYAEFLAEYTLDADGFMSTALVIVILLSCYAAVWGFFKIYVWGRINPENYDPNSYFKNWIANAVLTMMQTWSHLMFWCLFLMSAYWFIAFKLQQEAFVLLPPLEEWDDHYGHFDGLFGVILAFHTITVIAIIYRQGHADIFFVDWERPKRVQVQGELMDKVSVWRTLFVANEFDEMQTFRYVHVGFTLLLVLLVLEGFGLDNLAYARPDTSLDTVKAPKNYVIQYFLSTCVYVTFGFLQIVVPQLIARWIPTSLNTFNDLCQVANISVFVFDTPLHGYYIHGFAQSGQAEGDAEDLKNALEGVTGANRHTGLQLQKVDELEVYEVFASLDFRSRFDNLFRHHVQREIELSRSQPMTCWQRIVGRGLPKDVEIKELNKKKDVLNTHLRKYIEEIKKSGFGILDKRALQMLLRYPPDETTVRMTNLPILYRNSW
eukprot:CAMPEP_0115006268 /NCGR_PEP_ID=MMETSP0216-20121206/20393_1 /TAXON_ID=223996 /ORGANISM="Protocruzia adherens, Strain Boccale" /LENGTH=912 /DNA_ID=CAMNT_0002372807 /DNA_START=188 /DNA_END=2923 /DNA_ORIENTATION=-